MARLPAARPVVDDGALGARRPLVAGLGLSGRAAVRVLAARGLPARTYDDDQAADADWHAAARSTDVAGGPSDLAGGSSDVAGGSSDIAEGLPDERARLAAALADEGIDLVVTSPGLRPDHPLLAAARERGIEVISEVELAWRLRVDRATGGGPAPWLAVTGTNGKTTTVSMLAAILQANGEHAAAAGNVGAPLVLAATDPSLDVLAVELSSFQLHHTFSMSAQAAAVLNVAPDHLDWHGSLAAYAADKGRIYERAQVACVYNAADETTRRLAAAADVVYELASLRETKRQRAAKQAVAQPQAGGQGVQN